MATQNPIPRMAPESSEVVAAVRAILRLLGQQPETLSIDNPTATVTPQGEWDQITFSFYTRRESARASFRGVGSAE